MVDLVLGRGITDSNRDSNRDSNTKKAAKPICEECGLGCYSVLVANGIKGN
jgi:hypothetical protein